MSLTSPKVYKGTRSDDKRLCDTCSSGTILKGAADSKEFIHCSLLEREIPFRVVECSDYKDKSDTKLHQMEKIAWTLMTNKSGKSIGFISPEQWKRDHKWESKIDD